MNGKRVTILMLAVALLAYGRLATSQETVESLCGATRISQSHFKDRDGTELQNVSASRYVCTQCHVGQYDVEPLVGNDFEPLAVLPNP